MGIAIWIFSGLMVAWISYLFWPKSTVGSLANFSVAIVGGLIGGFLSTILYPSVDPLYNITGMGFLISLLVALIFLIGFRFAATRIKARKQKSELHVAHHE